MKTLAILSQKGGCGKTTLATCLAVAAEQAGQSTAILDLDPQATASFWKDVRGEAAPAVTAVPHIRLPGMLAALGQAKADLVIIDGAAVAQDVTHAAARVADFVLIPARPAAFDTMSMIHTLEVVRALGKPHAIVLTFIAPQGREAAEMMEMIAELGAPLAPATIGNRKAFFRAQDSGLAAQEYEAKGAAAREIAALYEFTLQQINSKKERAA